MLVVLCAKVVCGSFLPQTPQFTKFGIGGWSRPSTRFHGRTMTSVTPATICFSFGYSDVNSGTTNVAERRVLGESAFCPCSFQNLIGEKTGALTSNFTSLSILLKVPSPSQTHFCSSGWGVGELNSLEIFLNARDKDTVLQNEIPQTISPPLFSDLSIPPRLRSQSQQTDNRARKLYRAAVTRKDEQKLTTALRKDTIEPCRNLTSFTHYGPSSG